MHVFIDDLQESMRHADGAGLAAPQVYRSLRVCAFEVRAPNPCYPCKPSIPLTVMINPEITPADGDTFDNYEGCPSVPDVRGVVRRHPEIRLRYPDRDGRRHEGLVRGLRAGTFQHECDRFGARPFLDAVADPATLTPRENFERYHPAAFAKCARGIVRRCGGWSGARVRPRFAGTPVPKLNSIKIL